MEGLGCGGVSDCGDWVVLIREGRLSLVRRGCAHIRSICTTKQSSCVPHTCSLWNSSLGGQHSVLVLDLDRVARTPDAPMI